MDVCLEELVMDVVETSSEEEEAYIFKMTIGSVSVFRF